MTVRKPLLEGIEPEVRTALKFAAAVVDEVGKGMQYSQTDLLSAVQQHARWAQASGLPLDRAYLFRRDVIAVAVQQLPMRSEASLGRRRAVLMRVAEELGVAERSLPSLWGSEPSAPYGFEELAGLRLWASTQRADRRNDASTLLALGLGAGLTAAEICVATGADVSEDGKRILVSGARGRVVTVRLEWRDTSIRLRRDVGDGVLFLPSVRPYSNKISDFVRKTFGDQPRPKPQRMRATWLLQRMTDGIPIQNLLYEAGVKSLDALARFERYLPPPSGEGPQEGPVAS